MFTHTNKIPNRQIWLVGWEAAPQQLNVRSCLHGLLFPPWNHIYGQQGTWLGWSISLMFCSGFSQALAEQVCQSSFASSLTDCTGETIWIAITWQNLTYFKQRRVRNQDKKERGENRAFSSRCEVDSIPLLLVVSPPITAPAVLLIETHWSPNVPVESQGARFIVREKSFGCYCNPEQSAGHGI